jgi:hypothetical protein
VLCRGGYCDKGKQAVSKRPHLETPHRFFPSSVLTASPKPVNSRATPQRTKKP